MNPLLANNAPQAQNNNLQTAIRQIKQKIMGLQALGNPNAALTYFVQSNPNIQKAAQFVNQNGGDPKTVMETLLRQNGVNPDDVYNALK